MIQLPPASGADARTRRSPGFFCIAGLITPALSVVLVLFGGGLVFGLMQSLGYMPVVGMNALTSEHFRAIIADPDFMPSLGLTLYVAAVSTMIAAALSIFTALILHSLMRKSRIVYFIFQIPLTVPHLVIAVAMVFMLSPTGLLSRVALGAGLID